MHLHRTRQRLLRLHVLASWSHRVRPPQVPYMAGDTSQLLTTKLHAQAIYLCMCSRRSLPYERMHGQTLQAAAQ